MARSLAFLHTSFVHIQTFNTLLAELAPDIPVRHVVDERLQIIELLCDSAWRQFEQGNQEAYLREVADTLRSVAAQGDVIVLAQASMARAVELCPELALPVLTSPRSGLLAALQAYREYTVTCGEAS